MKMKVEVLDAYMKINQYGKKTLVCEVQLINDFTIRFVKNWDSANICQFDETGTEYNIRTIYSLVKSDLNEFIEWCKEIAQEELNELLELE